MQRCLDSEEKENAFKILKDVLSMIHIEISEKQQDPARKGKRPFHKALKYVLDQVKHE